MNDLISADDLRDLESPKLPTMPIGHGSVGWPGDDVVEDMDGDVTLIKVTLFAGHPLGEPVSSEGYANGYQVLVQPTWPLWFIPTKGQRVIIAFPDGDFQTPGNGIIIAAPGPSPKRQFAATKAIMDFSGYDLTIKAKSIGIVQDDPDGGTKAALSLSNGNCAMQSEDGGGFFVTADGGAMMRTLDPNGSVQECISLTQSALSLIDNVGSALVKLKSGNLDISAQNVNFNVANMFLGAGASPANQVIWGTGTPSTLVVTATANLSTGAVTGTAVCPVTLGGASNSTYTRT
jgi:hypothetical protein